MIIDIEQQFPMLHYYNEVFCFLQVIVQHGNAVGSVVESTLSETLAPIGQALSKGNWFLVAQAVIIYLSS